MAKTKPQPRKALVNIHIETGDSINGVFDKQNQSLSLQVIRDDNIISAQKIEYTKYYLRSSNKPKFLNKIEFQSSSDFTLSDTEIVQKFDCMWAIDTNRKEIFGELANVSAITEGDTTGSGEYTATLAIIFGLTKDNPELFGWRQFINIIMTNIPNSSTRRFGLIVDSELDKISQFNSRKLPIHGDFFLPENWTLIYATSDSGKESIFNKMLSESDKTSSKVINWVSKLEKNVKHWLPITDENTYIPTFLPLKKLEL